MSSLFQLQDTTGSPYTWMILPFCDVLIILLFQKNFFNFKYQPEEEPGAAEEQPASNKADAYTIERNWPVPVLFLCYLSVSLMAKKTYCCHLSHQAFLVRFTAYQHSP